MVASGLSLLLWLAQAAPAPATPAAPVPPAAKPAPAASPASAPAAAPMQIRDVRCPEKLDKAACSKLTSVLVSLAETSTVRKKLRTVLGGNALSVDIQEDSVDLSATVPPDKLSGLLDTPLRLQWQPDSSAFVAAGPRARGLYDGLQELLAVLAPDLALHGLGTFERGGAVTLLIRSGGALVQLGVDRQGKRLFLGTAAGARPGGAPAGKAPPASAASPPPVTPPSPAAGAIEDANRRQNPY